MPAGNDYPSEESQDPTKSQRETCDVYQWNMLPQQVNDNSLMIIGKQDTCILYGLNLIIIS